MVGMMVDAVQITLKRSEYPSTVRKEETYFSSSEVGAVCIDIWVVCSQRRIRNSCIGGDPVAKVSRDHDVGYLAVFPNEPQAERL